MDLGSTGGASVVSLTIETKSDVVFHVREFPYLISPVLRGFFSGYSGFPPSQKSTQIKTIEGHKFISKHNTVTCYPHKITLLTKLYIGTTFPKSNLIFVPYFG